MSHFPSLLCHCYVHKNIKYFLWDYANYGQIVSCDLEHSVSFVIDYVPFLSMIYSSCLFSLLLFDFGL